MTELAAQPIRRATSFKENFAPSSFSARLRRSESSSAEPFGRMGTSYRQEVHYCIILCEVNNSFAFINHIEIEEPQTDVAARVTFSKPAPETSIQVLPDAVFSCMPLLFCMDEMLKRMNDTGFDKACQEFARITDSEFHRAIEA